MLALLPSLNLSPHVGTTYQLRRTVKGVNNVTDPVKTVTNSLERLLHGTAHTWSRGHDGCSTMSGARFKSWFCQLLGPATPLLCVSLSLSIKWMSVAQGPCANEMK